MVYEKDPQSWPKNMLYEENPQSWWRKVPLIVWVGILLIVGSGLANGFGNHDSTAVTTTRTIDDTEEEAPARSLDDYWPPGLEVECGLGAAMFNDARADARESGDTAAMDRIMDEMNEMGCLG